jgi:membrane protein DedA with SNARE-associated domain
VNDRASPEVASDLAPPAARRGHMLVYAIPLGLMTVANLIGSAFMPYLLTHAPLVLVGLSPLFRHIVLVAPSVDAKSLFAVVVVRHFAPDPFMYFLGREYGPLGLAWAEANSPVVGKVARTLERLFAKVGPVALLVSPDVIVSTLAGAARVPFPVFVVVNVAGTVLTVVVARWFGDAFDRPIHVLMAFFQAHLVVVTVASVLVVVSLNWLSRNQTERDPVAPHDDDGAT